MIIWDLQYNYEGYMALALAQYEDLSSLLEVTFIGVRMAWRIRYSAASIPMCIGYVSMCHREEELYICLPSESNGPNLLDEPPQKGKSRLTVKVYNLCRV